MKPVGLLIDERFLEHSAPSGHPERAERLIAIGKALDASGLLARTEAVAARLVTPEEIRRIHRPEFADRLEQLLPGQAGRLDADTYFSPGTWDAARLAAGGVIDLALLAHAGEISSGAAFVRPPGHHAEPTRAMGFCLLNNVALAAAAVRAAGAPRVAIVDWDLHHGNGTQAAFYADPTVFYASIHQYPYYPGTGDVDELGAGAGRGTTQNVPFPAGMTDADYQYAFAEVVLPALRAFDPALVLVSAGFDAHKRDPLGGMRLTEDGYRWMTRSLLRLGRPLVAVLEGGYNLDALAQSSVAMMQEIVEPSDHQVPVADPCPKAVSVVEQVKNRVRDGV